MRLQSMVGATVLTVVCVLGLSLRGPSADESRIGRPVTLADADVAAPNFVGIKTWLNSAPLSIDDLRGKVVLVDFWTYGCYNCVNTLPHVTRLYRDYLAMGDAASPVRGWYGSEPLSLGSWTRSLQTGGGVLTGGVYTVGVASTFEIDDHGQSIATLAADLTLNGPGSSFETIVSGATVQIDDSLAAIAAGGALHILGGRSYTTAQSFADNGVLALGDGTFTASTPASAVGLRNTPYLADLDGDGIPDSVILDRSGKVAFRADGFDPDTVDKDLSDAINAALHPSSNFPSSASVPK